MPRHRILEPELLDDLDPDDPLARQARRDLARCNFLMGQAWLFRRLLLALPWPRAPRCLVDLGSGDALFTFGLARALAPHWPKVTIFLVDRRPAITPATLAAFKTIGWQAHTVQADAIAHVRDMPPADLVLTNRFLHHLPEADLQQLFAAAAAKAPAFAACEPRRSALALSGSRLLPLIGCGPVARKDAVISVRAGFRDGELSRLWPQLPGWSLEERSAGLFSHAFCAWRTGAPLSP